MEASKKNDAPRLDLSDLLTEPRGLNAELVITRVRSGLDDIARELEPRRPAVTYDSELQEELDRSGQELVLKLEKDALQIEWGPMRPWVAILLSALEAWELTGADEAREALVAAVKPLEAAWVRAIMTAQSGQGAAGDESGAPYDEREATSRAAVRELALQGWIVDSGKRQGGQIAWVGADEFAKTSGWLA